MAVLERDPAEHEMLLGSLKLHDIYCCKILGEANPVILYVFDGESDSWKKTDIEGTLYVYSRSIEPVNGFIILNRVNRNNVQELVTPHLDFQIKDPFLLYKNKGEHIYGIWFFDSLRCSMIGQLLNSMAHRLCPPDGGCHSHEALHGVGHGKPIRLVKNADSPSQSVDIMQMLMRAHSRYSTPPPTAPMEPMAMTSIPVAGTHIMSGNLPRPRPVRAVPAKPLVGGRPNQGPRRPSPRADVSGALAMVLGVGSTRGAAAATPVAVSDSSNKTVSPDQQRSATSSVGCGSGDKGSSSGHSMPPVLMRLFSESSPHPEKGMPKTAYDVQSIEAQLKNELSISPPTANGDEQQMRRQESAALASAISGGSHVAKNLFPVAAESGVIARPLAGGVSGKSGVVRQVTDKPSDGIITSDTGLVTSSDCIMGPHMVKTEHVGTSDVPDPGLGSVLYEESFHNGLLGTKDLSVNDQSGKSSSYAEASSGSMNMPLISSFSAFDDADMASRPILIPPSALELDPPEESQGSTSSACSSYHPAESCMTPTQSMMNSLLHSSFQSPPTGTANLQQLSAEQPSLQEANCQPANPQQDPERVPVLTKQQFQSAFVNLLKTDENFLTAIYESYMDSVRVAIMNAPLY